MFSLLASIVSVLVTGFKETPFMLYIAEHQNKVDHLLAAFDVSTDIYTSVGIYKNRHEPCAVINDRPLLSIIAGVTPMLDMSNFNNTDPEERVHFDHPL